MRRVGRSCVSSLASGVLLSALSAGPLAAEVLGPVDVSGYLGYNYRSLSENGGQDSLSHQLNGTVNASSYLWQPWLATTDASLTFTQDSSEYSSGQISDSTSSQILTGNIGLNILPKSRAPFTARLQFSDSRVDREQTGGTPVTFVGEEYSSTYLGLKQLYLGESGDRFQARLDLRSWDSARVGSYSEQSIGLDADVRRAQQRFVARGNYSATDYSASDRENNSTVLDLSHFYYPSRAFRLDSKVSVYDYDRSFLDPNSQDTRLSSTQITQVSSFAFWRPQASPWTVSAGMRVSLTDSSPDASVGTDQLQLAANAGVFYRVSQYLRFDANVSANVKDSTDNVSNASVTNEYYRSRLGALYSSKWYSFDEFMYQWYADGSLEYNVDPLSKTVFADANIGQNFSRTWWPIERTTPGSLRFSFNQAIVVGAARGSYASNAAQVEKDIYDMEMSSNKLRHSASLAFNSPLWNGDMLAQVTLSDSREMGDLNAVYQLINAQFNCTQEIGGKSLLSGNFTVQQVLSEYDEVIRYSGFDDAANRYVVPGDVVTRERDTKTSTASIRFEHMRAFGVPRLRFTSNYMVSKISASGALDREDWDNALNYRIGMLDANVSYRVTDTDGRSYDLLYFRVMRRF